jgi:hypothetical protein
MTKEELKKLKPGKKVYIVNCDDYCDCPFCDGSCNEPEMFDMYVEGTDVKKGQVYVSHGKTSEYSVFLSGLWYNYKEVFTRKREATKVLKKLLAV